MIRFLWRTLRRFSVDLHGNFAITTALCALPMFGMAGLAVDYATLLSDKVKLDAAADAAAVTAITRAQLAIRNGSTTADAAAAGQAQGVKSFYSNAGSVAFIQSGSPTPVVTVNRIGTNLSASVSYATKMKTNFGSLFGVQTFNLTGGASSVLSLPTYKNYYILLDVSNSMGIGATQTDMNKLYARTQAYGNGSNGDPGCVFACHVASPGRTYSNEQLARMSPPVTLRIDSAKLAIQSMITSAQASPNASRINIGLYTLDEVHLSSSNIQQPTVQKIQDLSSNWSALSSAVNTIDLGQNDGNVGYGDTDFTSSLGEFNTNILPTAGDGSTPTTPLNYVFIITDGMQDTFNPGCTWGHCDNALSSTLCQSLKAKGALVGVIYTTYLPVYVNNDATKDFEITYKTLAQPYVSNIVPALQTCASTPTSNFFFEATTGTDITTGIQQLFTGTDTPARLTQ